MSSFDHFLESDDGLYDYGYLFNSGQNQIEGQFTEQEIEKYQNRISGSWAPHLHEQVFHIIKADQKEKEDQKTSKKSVNKNKKRISKDNPKIKLLNGSKKRTEKDRQSNKQKKTHSGFQYPTKNFLQNFKSAHYEYLQKFYTVSELMRFPCIDKLKGTCSMSLKAYTELYREEAFKVAFEKMFAQKFLYRAMMLSRSGWTSKKNHMQKLKLFEKAFYSKIFTQINRVKLSCSKWNEA